MQYHHIAPIVCRHSQGYRLSMIVDGLLFHVSSCISYVHHGIECRLHWPCCLAGYAGFSIQAHFFELGNLFLAWTAFASSFPALITIGCIYAPYKVNPNIFQFYFDFLDISHHTSMHPLFCNIYEFYLIFYDFISSSIIYNNYLYSRWHFLFWFRLALDLLILSHASCPELKSRLCMRS